MGNLQCGASSASDNDSVQNTVPFGAKVYLYFQSSAIANSGQQALSMARRNPHAVFLRVHLEEPDSKVLLAKKEVTAALVEQVEEMVRRENLQNCASSITSTSTTSENNASTSAASVKSTDCSVERLSRIPSIFDTTVVTTVSAATRKAGNSPERKSRKATSKKQHSPRFLGGTEYTESETLRKHIHSEVTASDQRSLYADIRRTYCNILEPFMLHEEQAAICTRNVKNHMTVLHLRLRLKCVSYYKLHLSRKQPNDPLTLAVANGIQTTSLSPLRKSRQHQHHPALPDLIHLSKNESYSSSGAMDFGAGPPSSPVRLLVTNSVFLDLAVTGSLGLASRKRRPRAAYVDRKLLKSPDEYVILLNRRSGVPLAVCALRAPTIKGEPPVVRMFTTKRRVEGQWPAATTGKLDITWSESLPLYAWAEFVTEGVYPDTVCYSIYLVSDSDGSFEASPSYRATHEAPGSPEIMVTGRTGRECRPSGCAVLSMCVDENDDEMFLKLSMSKGIDPALLICFSCFIDETLEKTMRLQSKA